ncbi:SRPBCC family protein [Maritalea sp.]|uniref:SRPBCC family protein n=1 Tax=Maritalea sp. TaxID=2003361 RepID=UPI003EF1DD6F
MPSLTVSQQFMSDQQTAFNVISDFPNAANYIDGILKVEMLTDGPVAVGSRVRETRIMMGREATEEMEVTQMDAPDTFVVKAFSRGTEYITTYTLEPAGDYTKVTLHFRATPKTFMSKVMAAVFSRMMPTIADLMQKDLIQASIEAERRATA